MPRLVGFFGSFLTPNELGGGGSFSFPGPFGAKDPGDAPASAFEFQPTKIKTMLGGYVSWKECLGGLLLATAQVLFFFLNSSSSSLGCILVLSVLPFKSFFFFFFLSWFQEGVGKRRKWDRKHLVYL